MRGEECVTQWKFQGIIIFIPGQCCSVWACWVWVSTDKRTLGIEFLCSQVYMRNSPIFREVLQDLTLVTTLGSTNISSLLYNYGDRTCRTLLTIAKRTKRPGFPQQGSTKKQPRLFRNTTIATMLHLTQTFPILAHTL